MKIQLTIILCSVLILNFCYRATAQQPKLVLDTTTSSVSSYSHSEVQNPVLQGIDCDPPAEVIDNGRPFFTSKLSGNIWGGAHTLIKRGLPNCKVSSSGTGNILIKNNGSSSIYLQWWCHSIGQYDCYDPDCPWYARDTSSVDARVVIRIEGLPAGTPVTVGFDWKHFSSIANRPEAITEDNAEVNNTFLDLFGRAGFGSAMNMNGPIKFAQNATGDSLKIFNAVAGDSLVIEVRGRTLAYIFPPPYTPLNPREDDASADFFGFVNIYVSAQGSPLPVPTVNCPDNNLHFSVDIGGDIELSDPKPDGNELLDPGDLYAQGATTPAPSFNDSVIFKTDPAPSVALPAGTCFPGPLQQWQHVLNFDLDGVDQIDFNFSVSHLNYGLMSASIPEYQTDCIFSPQYALISYDEDRGVNFSSAANCNVPSSFDLMDTVLLKGTTSDKDEVIYVSLSNQPGSVKYTGTAFPYTDEAGLAPVLSPSPKNSSDIGVNDDVDALDYISNTACNILYFSVDHEAHYIHNGDTLRPGIIYQLISYGTIQPVIHPILHLGLSSDRVDIDAFEFAWLYDSAQARNGLALVFSVSANDPFDATDYTGGLDPGALYASFLDGTYFEMTPLIKPGNIDGLTFICKPQTPPGSVFIKPVITGYESPQQDFTFNLFPNPNKGGFNLEFMLNEKSRIQVNIIDISGRIVWCNTPVEMNRGTQQIQITDLQLGSGLYLAELKMLTGEKQNVLRKKFAVIK